MRSQSMIRPAEPRDLPAVRSLLRAAALPLDGLEDRFGGGYCVAEAGGHVVGAAGVEVYGTFGLLRSVVVSPEWRGRGLGEHLVQDRLAWAGTAGLEAVYLLTTTAADFFPRLGFAVTERGTVPAEVRASREFASVCPATAVVQSITIGRSSEAAR